MIKRIVIYLAIFSMTFSMAPLARAQYETHTELISLDLKGMDIRDVLKILSQKSGLNIVADSEVKGTVALYIKDVDIMDALDIIVSTNGLAYEQEGTLIRVMTDKKYEELHGKGFEDKTRTEIVRLHYANASSVAKAISDMKTRAGKIIADDRSNTIVLMDSPGNIEKMRDAISEMDVPLVTEVFSLDYAKAEAIKDKLEQVVSEGAGAIKFDERTNKIVIKDTPQRIIDIKKVIEAFDEKTREVIIDAHIIQVTLTDKYSHGIDWSSVATLGDLTLASTTNLTTSLTGTTPSTFAIAKKGGTHSTIIKLLETFGETNVLSRPRITVADREEAKILVGAKEVYVTSEITTATGGTYHTTDHVQFVDVGVRLAVSPEINNDGYIKLKIKPEVSSTDATKTVTLTNPDGSTRTIVPFVNTSEAETVVLVKDDTTLIIGGLMKDTITDQKQKVPFLGDLPIVGKLFSTSGESKEKTELVIFLTPHIIEGDETTEEAESYLYEWEEKKEKGWIDRPDASKYEWFKEARVKDGIEAEELLEELAISDTDIKLEPYAEYYLTIRKRINDVAEQQDVSGAGEVELQFTLDRQGFLTMGPVVLNKPDLGLVRAAVDCVKLASPFPAFPSDMRKEELDFYVVVRYGAGPDASEAE